MSRNYLLNYLRNAYLEAVENLIRKYPVQEQNRASYEAWAADARLGVVTRKVITKGGLSDYDAGDFVIFVPDRLEDGLVSVWGRTDGDSLRTLVHVNAVREI